MLVLWWTGCSLIIISTIGWMWLSVGDGIPWDAIFFGVLSLAGFARLYPLARNYDEAGRR